MRRERGLGWEWEGGGGWGGGRECGVYEGKGV